MDFANLILGILWIVLWLYWLISAFGAKKSAVRVSYWRNHVAWRLALLVVVILTIKLSGVHRFSLPGYFSPPSPTLETAGVLICALGLGFAFWARVHLGKNWGMPMTVRKEPELITSGPYRLVRHPIYAGLLLGILGSALVEGTTWLFVFVVCAPYFVFSAISEEKTMMERFPDQYPEYKRRTRMLIPYLW